MTSTSGRHAPSVLGARLVGGTIQVLASESLALPVGIAIAALLARSFGAAGYGVFALALSMVAAAEWVISALLTRATIKIVGETGAWRSIASVALRWHLLAGIAAAAPLWLAAGPLSSALHEPRLRSCLAWLALEIPFVATSTGCRSILVARGRFHDRAVAGAVRWIARLAAIVIIVSLGFSIDGAAAGNVIGAAIGLVVARAYVGRLDDNGDAHRWSLRAPAGFWHVAVPTFVFAMSLRLLDKLGLKPGMRLAVLGFGIDDAWLEGLPYEVELGASEFDAIVVGLRDLEGLDDVPACLPRLAERGMLWLVFPKGRKDFSEASVFATGKALGLVDVKVCRFDDVYTALKFVRPRG